MTYGRPATARRRHGHQSHRRFRSEVEEEIYHLITVYNDARWPLAIGDILGIFDGRESAVRVALTGLAQRGLIDYPHPDGDGHFVTARHAG